MLYPAYEAGVLKGSPLIKLKFMNLIMDSKESVSTVTSAKEGGLIGTIDGFSYKPEMNNSQFFQDEEGLYPQTLNLECTFIVLHTHEVGIDIVKGSNFKERKYPYNLVDGEDERNRNGGSNTRGTTSQNPPADGTAAPGTPQRREAEAANNL